MSFTASAHPADRLDPEQESALILQLHQVTCQFSPTGPAVVCQVSFALEQGAILALLGPSGCGKTTLLRLIAGFETPQTGRIEIAQQQVAGDRVWVAPEKRGVGMVFQDYALFPHLTVGENIAFGLSHRLSAQLKQQRVEETLTLVNLQALAQRYPHQLSGGQQQRVALARALAPQPFLILLDEPLSNLDVQVRLELRQELRRILKAAGASAIFVTHDQEEALSIADYVAVMRAGKLEQFATPEVLYQQPMSVFVATFVTQANLIPAERQGSAWQTELGQYPIGQTQPIASESEPMDRADRVDLMVRPEDLHLQPDQKSQIVVIDRQFLGREYRYHLRLPSGQTAIARTPTEVLIPLQTPVRVTITAPFLTAFVAALPL